MRPGAPWAIVEIDLDALPRQLTPPDDANALLMLYRFRGAVLGMQFVMPENARLTQAELAAQAALSCWHPVSRLLASGGEPEPAWVPGLDSPSPFIPSPNEPPWSALAPIIDAIRRPAQGKTASIIICTRRRPADLAACLKTIASETRAGREIVVVDNGPDDETRAVVAAHPPARYVPEPTPGLSAARNAGIAAATGEFAVFVDDDVRPEPGWIEPLLHRFTAPDIAVVCGLVLPYALSADAEIGFQLDLGFGGMGLTPLLFDRRFVAGFNRGVPVWDIGAGANMAVRRETVIALGGFDERLGPGAIGGCGDDTEYWHRALMAGHRAVYEPASIVRHQHRREEAALRRQAYGYGLGHVTALMAQYRRDGDRGDLRRAFINLPAGLLRRVGTAPLKPLKGGRDRLLWPFAKGFLVGLRHLPLIWQRPPPDVFRGRLQRGDPANGR